MNFYWLWLKRVLFSPQTIFQFSALFSLLGLILAVAVLTVALLAFNGFSSGLEKSLVDKQGHIRIQSQKDISKKAIMEELDFYKDWISDQALFLSFEGLILHKGLFKGVIFESVEDEKLKSLSFLKQRILEGSLTHSEPFLIIGSALAQELNLKVDSFVEVIVSQSENFYFSRKRSRFKIGAISDFGRYDFNISFALLNLSSAKVLGFNKVSGANLWLKDKNQLDFFVKKLEQDLENFYFVSSWKSADKYFFEVIESDKRIIFFVLLILIVTAGFNISSSLFVQVFRKTKDISILKAMGAKKSLLINLFLLNGLILGLVGTTAGLFLGLAFCKALIMAQNKWHFIPEKIYKVNEIIWDWQSADLFLIFTASLFVVIVSSLLPARKAYKMSVTKGLSYQ